MGTAALLLLGIPALLGFFWLGWYRWEVTRAPVVLPGKYGSPRPPAPLSLPPGSPLSPCVPPPAQLPDPLKGLCQWPRGGTQEVPESQTGPNEWLLGIGASHQAGI